MTTLQNPNYLITNIFKECMYPPKISRKIIFETLEKFSFSKNSKQLNEFFPNNEFYPMSIYTL